MVDGSDCLSCLQKHCFNVGREDRNTLSPVHQANPEMCIKSGVADAGDICRRVVAQGQGREVIIHVSSSSKSQICVTVSVICQKVITAAGVSKQSRSRKRV